MFWVWLSCVGVACAAYLIGGHRLIHAIYDGTAPAWLNRALEYRSTTTVEMYLRKSDIRFGLLLAFGSIGFWTTVLMRRHRHRLAVGACLKTAAYLVYLVVLLEVGTRVYFGLSDQDIDVYRHFSFRRMANILTPDPVLGYRMIPNAKRNAFTSDFQVIYETNSLGLRDRELRQTNRFKVLALGDSQTFGVGVAYGDRFTEVIEKLYPQFDIINAGVEGYSVNHMWRWFVQEGLKLKPDLVACCIIMPDLRRSVYARRATADAPHLIRYSSDSNEPSGDTRTPEPTPQITVGGELAQSVSAMLLRSYLYSYLRVRLKLALMKGGVAQRDRQVFREIRQKDKLNTTRTDQELVRDTAVADFSAFQQTVQAAGTRLLVVNIDERAEPWLDDVLEDIGIPFVDLSPILKRESGTHFTIDPHYNEKGHRIIGQQLGEYLSREYGPCP